MYFNCFSSTMYSWNKICDESLTVHFQNLFLGGLHVVKYFSYWSLKWKIKFKSLYSDWALPMIFQAALKRQTAVFHVAWSGVSSIAMTSAAAWVIKFMLPTKSFLASLHLNWPGLAPWWHKLPAHLRVVQL